MVDSMTKLLPLMESPQSLPYLSTRAEHKPEELHSETTHGNGAPEQRDRPWGCLCPKRDVLDQLSCTL